MHELLACNCVYAKLKRSLGRRLKSSRALVVLSEKQCVNAASWVFVELFDCVIISVCRQSIFSGDIAVVV